MFKEIENLNRSIFLAINAKPGAPDAALKIACFFANTLIYVIPIIILLFMVCQ
jgi:undecaprenyl-diphosphatase